MPIGLMSYIPNNFIVWRIEDVVKSYSQLNHTQAGSEMAGIITDHIYNILPEFRTHLRKIVRIKFPEVVRSIYFGE
jgi:hypothetical protein